MINNYISLSEDDIRSKVVYEWLKDCGLKESNIIIEYSINLRIGRGIKNINSRTDVLVKNDLGQNLLIVEVKRPNHSLKDIDGQQALSYARALAEGGIAPFTILTNGKDVKIYDSVTGEEIIDNIISNTHPYVKNGFFVSGDALQAKAEALEYLVSYSKENLLIFCKAQVEHRMKLLKSNDLFSGKKYIPQLYVERSKAKKDLEGKLFNKDNPNQIVLVIGPPQHGKTCFLCNTVESFINNEIPVLFYPAISLKKGLLNEIQDDFEWFFGEQSIPSHLINRINKITKQIGQNLIIVIDGWNEMFNNALQLNDECQRLHYSNIKFVLSTTSSSVTRLLQDEAGNLSYVAGEAKLKAATIRKLTNKPLGNTEDISVVQIETFDYNELAEGKVNYESAYNTRFDDNSNLPKDPFYLRLAAEIYADNSVPAFATRTELIKTGLILKAIRRGIQEIDLFVNLNEIASLIMEIDSPIRCTDLPISLRKDDIISLWVESAILIRLYEKEIPDLDFYYSHEKDYCIAILSRRLHDRLINADGETVYQELLYITKSESGQSALRWFLSCPEYAPILKDVFILLIPKGINNQIIIKILSDSIMNQVTLNKLSFRWLERYITDMISIQTDKGSFYTNLCDLIFSFLCSLDPNKEKGTYEFWMRLLVKYDEDVTRTHVSNTLIYDFFGGTDIELMTYFEEDTDTVDLFMRLVFDEDLDIARNAAAILSYAHPLYMLKKLPSITQIHQQNNSIEANRLIENSSQIILKHLYEVYYGSMCPGLLSGGDTEIIVPEFYKQKSLWFPILKLLDPNSNLYSEIIDLLKNLSEYVEDDDSLAHPPSNDPNQLKIDFNY